MERNESDTPTTSRRNYLRATGGLAVVGATALAGCSGQDVGGGVGEGAGTLATRVAGQSGDTSDFDSLVVTINGLWVQGGDGGAVGTGTDTGEEGDTVSTGDETPAGGNGSGDGEDIDAPVTVTGENESQAEGTEVRTDGEVEVPVTVTGENESQAEGTPVEEINDNETEEESPGGGTTPGAATEDEATPVGTATGDQTGTGEGANREYHEFEQSQEVDLVEIQDGESELIDERNMQTGEFSALLLDVTDVNATLSGGEEATVETPDGGPLRFNEDFELRSDARTVFTAAFTSVESGQDGGYVLQPSSDGTEVSYESTDDTATETAGETTTEN